jgi:hypothetical protein
MTGVLLSDNRKKRNYEAVTVKTTQQLLFLIFFFHSTDHLSGSQLLIPNQLASFSSSKHLRVVSFFHQWLAQQSCSEWARSGRWQRQLSAAVLRQLQSRSEHDPRGVNRVAHRPYRDGQHQHQRAQNLRRNKILNTQGQSLKLLNAQSK